MRKLLFVSFLMLGGCASLPPEAPVPTPSASPKYITGAWKNEAWDNALEEDILQAELPSVAEVKDAASYCPKYSKLTVTQKTEFYHVLFVAMAKRESSWKPETTYQENFNDAQGKPVISTGLFQISPESASSAVYGCGKMTPALLKNPIVNIACSVKIAARWIKKDGYIGSTVNGAHLGCARYWSVCRNASSSQPYLRAQTNALSFCK